MLEVAYGDKIMFRTQAS